MYDRFLPQMLKQLLLFATRNLKIVWWGLWHGNTISLSLSKAEYQVDQAGISSLIWILFHICGKKL